MEMVIASFIMGFGRLFYQLLGVWVVVLGIWGFGVEVVTACSRGVQSTASCLRLRV